MSGVLPSALVPVGVGPGA